MQKQLRSNQCDSEQKQRRYLQSLLVIVRCVYLAENRFSTFFKHRRKPSGTAELDMNSI